MGGGGGKLTTNLTDCKVYTNNYTNLRRAETKKEELDFEAWEKETSNKISLKKIFNNQRKDSDRSLTPALEAVRVLAHLALPWPP